MVDKKPQSAFEVYFFGCDRQGEEYLGDDAGSHAGDGYPRLPGRAGTGSRKVRLSYAAWEKDNRDRLLEIAAAYTS